MGFMQGNVPTYVSEIVPVNIRGFMLSLFQPWIIVGQLLASCVLQGTLQINGVWSWKTAVMTQFLPVLICLILYIPFVPESPYFLVTTGRLDMARAAVAKIHKGEAGFDINLEMEHIQHTIEYERQQQAQSPSYLECFKGSNRRRTLVACLPLLMQIFMGYPLCGNYLTYFLKLSGVGDPFLITVIAVICSLAASLVAFIFIEKIGRRRQLLAGTFTMLPILLAISLLGWLGTGTRANAAALATFAILWNCMYFLGVGVVGWTLVGEISSARLRARTVSLAGICSSLSNMSWSIAIPYLVNAEEAGLGPKAGLIFLAMGIPLALLAFFTIPETKNKSTDELDALFEAGTPARKF